MARAGVIGLDLGGTKIAAALFQAHGEPAAGVGIAVPGIYRAATETVWAPNIPGWDDYPLVAEVRGAVPDGMTVRVDSDRACAILLILGMSL
jgi:glucokinase